MVKETFLNSCYELYKKDWCLARDVMVEDVDEEVGINGGECFVSLDEFEQNEFQDEEYMKLLLDSADFQRWQQTNKTVPEPGEVGIKVYFDGVHMDTVWVPEKERDATINSIARHGFADYNADVKEDWVRLNGSERKPALSFEVVCLARAQDELDRGEEDIISSLMSRYPDRATSFSPELMRSCLEHFRINFGINKENTWYGSVEPLDKLNFILGKDYRNSDLLFDIATVFDKNYDPESWHPDECWELSIKKVVGEDVFVQAFEEYEPVSRYKVVLTCFDPGEKPYCDNLTLDPLFTSMDEAYNRARAAAMEECSSLNGEDDGNVPEVGCFEVDDCANNDFEVRWYEQKPEERSEGDCDIEYVTTYNVYPVVLNNVDDSYKYRGFDIKQMDDGLKIYHNGTRLGGTVNILGAALNRVDDICLECAKDKAYALEAVHKVPLDVVIKFAGQQQKQQPVSAANKRYIEDGR